MAKSRPRAADRQAEQHSRPAHAAERKQQVLTKKTPSRVQSIANAITIIDRDVYAVCRPDGSMPGGQGHGFGLYYHDCRYLHDYKVTLNDQRLNVLAASATHGFEAVFQLTNPDLPGIDEYAVAVHLNRVARGAEQALHDTYRLESFAGGPVELALRLCFDADFLDIFAIRDLLDERPGKRREPAWRDGVLTFAYDGKDGLLRTLDVSFSRDVTPQGRQGACFQLTLQPGEHVELEVTLAITESKEGDGSPRRVRHGVKGAVRSLLAARQGWVEDRALVEANAPLFNRVYRQAFYDLHALVMELRGKCFYAAGVPWFATLFGRDSLVASLQTLAYDREVAAQTLRLLAHYQGREDDSWRDEQPGKILHELRVGELARLNEIPHTPYYGSIDATPLFLFTIAEHARWSGTLALFDELRPQVDAALSWIDREMDDGYLSYDSLSEGGLVNQGWKDSGNAIVNKDGSLAQPPIALVEVQSYVFQAWVAIADLFERAGDPDRAKSLRRQAAALKVRFNRDFWLAGRHFYALALQRDDAPVASITSNPGQALWAGAIAEDRAKSVVERLMDDDMFSGWGVRTLSTRETRYNPVSYHLGTVWPHDNALIAAGFRRYGFDAEAQRIHTGLFEAATHFADFRMPELFSGYPAEPFDEPVRYPVACHPQAWAAGSLPYLLVTMLGLEPDAFERRLRIRRPMLLDLVSELALKGLCVGDAVVDLCFRRHGDQIQVEVTRRDGDLSVELLDA